METLFQILAGVMLAVVLGTFLNKQNREIGAVLAVVVCCLVFAASAVYLRPILQFLEQLQELGSMDPEAVGVMLKIVGIGLIGEIAGLICSDSGNAAMGKALQTMTTLVILWLSLPMMKALLDLVQEILGEV